MRLVVFLVCCVNTVQGLRCLQCQDVPSVKSCTWSGTCAQNEACYTRSLMSYKGNKAYQMGCAHENLCHSFNFRAALIGKREVGLLEYNCNTCCYKDDCNGKLCPGNYTIGKDCLDLKQRGYTKSQVYVVNPDGGANFSVYCDMTTEGGGWTVFQRRHSGPLKFTRNWTDFKHGFGDVHGEFWLGNEKLHRLTTARHCGLRLTYPGYYAEYASFTVAPESDNYRVSFLGYHGNDGDRFSRQNGTQFTTYDRDNDVCGTNCAIQYTGAWWHYCCYHLDLNGVIDGHYEGGYGSTTSTMAVR